VAFYATQERGVRQQSPREKWLTLYQAYMALHLGKYNIKKAKCNLKKQPLYLLLGLDSYSGGSVCSLLHASFLLDLFLNKVVCSSETSIDFYRTTRRHVS
jgi:hypothetical protein